MTRTQKRTVKRTLKHIAYGLLIIVLYPCLLTALFIAALYEGTVTVRKNLGFGE
jgi:hypothetical protein